MKLGSTFLLAVLVCSGQQTLLNAIREGRTDAVEQALASGADVNTHDDSGATALMYASAFASPDCVRLLLDKGANVNAANEAGSTALMWALRDAEKVKLLLDRGADPNARAKDETTALMAAARIPGNIETIRLLLAKGVDPKSAGSANRSVADTALLFNDREVVDLLRSKGAEFGPAMKGTSAAYIASNMQSYHLWLDAGGNPNAKFNIATMELPVLGYALFAEDTKLVQRLLKAGADPNATGSHGYTPLMLAAATPNPSVENVKILLAAGAKLDPKDEYSLTALDWALLQGETAVAKVLREAGAKQSAAPPSTPPAVQQARSAGDAVAKALTQLQPASPVFFKKGGCISCHNNSLPGIAAFVARKHGVPGDPQLADHPRKATLASWGSNREPMMRGQCLGGGFVANTSYGLVQLAAEDFAPNPVTDAAALCLAELQKSDGRWDILDTRPPLGDSPIKFTALAVRGLSTYMPPGQAESWRARKAKALAFLRTAPVHDTQDAAFRAIGLKWAGATEKEVLDARTQVLKLRNSDGAWSQKPTMAPDAYATGQALSALHISGLDCKDAAYQKGIRWLLKTQGEDGTWFVRSRAFAFQPPMETGFPHGRNQFISAAATAWSTLAIAYSLETHSSTAALR